MKKTLLALGLAAILLTGCDGPTKVTKTITTAIQPISIAVDVNHALILDSNNDLWATGESTDGEFGASPSTVSSPIKIASNVESFAKGENYTLIVKTDGSLWATGDNDNGQLGLGDTTDRTQWVQVMASGVKSVAAGDNHTLIVKTDGTVWATGENNDGQLGLGNTTSVNSFTQVPGISNAKSVAVNKRGWIEGEGGNSAIVLNDGTMYVTGVNDLGQLGLGNNTNISTFTLVSGLTNVKEVVLGAFHSAVVKTSGELLQSGDNFFGQFGNGGKTGANVFTQVATDVSHVDVGVSYTLYSGIDGFVYGSGDNWHGMFGNGAKEIAYTSFIKTNTVSNVSEVSAGRFSSYALTGSGDLYSTGDNFFGQLGTGNNIATTTYTKINE